VTHADLLHFIARSKLGVLSSIGEASGTPQSALVGFAVTENLEIVFDTVKSSRKYGNLIARPAAPSFSDGQESRRCSTKAQRKSLPGRSCRNARKFIFAHGLMVLDD
jgi:Pyridoxamine 5'-phosphate oxidase